MKKYIIPVLLMLFCYGLVYAQDGDKPEKKKERPVRNYFKSGILMDAQTSVIPTKHTLEMQIQHRFGLIKTNGISDLFGIYAPSANTRMGLNFSILDNLMVGYGITRKNMYSDFQAKWTFLQQSRSGKIPLNVSVYTNMAIDSRNEKEFGENYEFSNRLSYFSQLLVGRKFTKRFTLEMTVSFTHYNSVKSEIPNDKGYEHDVFGWGGHLRFQFSPQSSFLVMFTMPVYIESLSENHETLNSFNPNFGVSYEVATSTHVFQIFFTTANGILPQDIHMYNLDEATNGEYRLGFNITRLWNF